MVSLKADSSQAYLQATLVSVAAFESGGARKKLQPCSDGSSTPRSSSPFFRLGFWIHFESKLWLQVVPGGHAEFVAPGGHAEPKSSQAYLQATFGKHWCQWQPF